MQRSIILASLLGLTACGGRAKIEEFSVTPRRICAGTPISIGFKVKGEPHLTVTRRGGTGADTTTYVLMATTAKDTAHSTMEVITFSADQVLAFNTAMLGRDSLLAGDSLPAEAWSTLVVGAVVADPGRALLVHHAGKEARLNAGSGPSDAWRGTPMSGRWEIHAPLLAGEIPGNPTRHPPAHLTLTVGVVCSGSPS